VNVGTSEPDCRFHFVNGISRQHLGGCTPAFQDNIWAVARPHFKGKHHVQKQGSCQFLRNWLWILTCRESSERSAASHKANRSISVGIVHGFMARLIQPARCCKRWGQSPNHPFAEMRSSWVTEKKTRDIAGCEMDLARRVNAPAHNPKNDHECKDQLVVERPLPTIYGGRGLFQVTVGGVAVG